MNIDCDRRAEEFYSHLDETQQSSALINPIESMQVYFRSNGVINTGKLYTQTVRDRHGPPLKQYIKDKYHWNEEQFNSIAWPSIKMAFQSKTPQQKVHLAKAIYHWLPTMARLHRITPEEYPTPTCNICKISDETQDHIYQCNHHASRSEQIKMLRKIEKEGEASGINTFLIRTLTKGLHAWMHHLPPPRISVKRHPVHKLVAEAYAAQALLGWRHAIRGRISVKWIEAQELHMNLRHSTISQGHHIIRSLWTAMEYLWRARNTMEHGTPEEEGSLHQTARINVRLKRAYETKGKLHFVSRNQLFNVPLRRRQQYTHYKNERWLELVEAAAKNRRRQKEKLNETLSTMTHFYTKRNNDIILIRSKKAAEHVPQEYRQFQMINYYERNPRARTSTAQQEIIHTRNVPKVQI